MYSQRYTFFLSSFFFLFFIELTVILRNFHLGAGENERGGGGGGSYNYGQGGSGDPYSGSYGGNYDARGADAYGRGSGGRGGGDAYGGGHGGGDAYGGGRGDGNVYSGSRRGGYGGQGASLSTGDNENYPSNYHVVPMPGASNCTGSGCCVPKCFAEKGSRVSFIEN